MGENLENTTDSELSLAAIGALLDEKLNGKLDPLLKRIDSINDSVTVLRENVKLNERNVNETTSRVETLEKKNKELGEQLDTTQKELRELSSKVLQNEVHSRRENLRFYGIPEERNEN